MQRSISLAVGALLLLTGGVALGDDGGDCAKINLTLRPGVTFLAPGDDLWDEFVPRLETYWGVSFEWCFSQQVVGTIAGAGIHGTWVACGAWDLVMLAPLFPQVSGDMGPGPIMGLNPCIIHTDRGDIFCMSHFLSAYEGPSWEEFVGFSGLSWYGGGTGVFEGAAGWSTDSPKTQPPSDWVVSVGRICRED